MSCEALSSGLRVLGVVEPCIDLTLGLGIGDGRVGDGFAEFIVFLRGVELTGALVLLDNSAVVILVAADFDIGVLFIGTKGT